MNNNVLSVFGLTFKQTCLLFSAERLIIVNDITYSEMQNKIDEANLKKAWLKKWDSQINAYLKELESNNCSVIGGIESIDPQLLFNSIKNESKNLAWKYLILLESILFNPYYPLEKIEDKGMLENFKEKFKQLSLNKDNRIYSLNKIATILEINHSYIEILQKRYESSLNKLSGFWEKIAIGVGIGAIVTTAIVLFFINPIAGAIAGPGLYGAVAFNVGMAALGGGAIAAGGFGVAGGIAVLVGGSIVLGGSTGAVIGAFANNPKIMMTEMAKMEVVLKEIILGIQKDTKLFQDILLQLIDNENEMKMEIKRLKLNVEANKEKIKNLEEAVKYLEKGINELRK